MLLPVYGFVEGDVLVLVVLAHEHHKASEFADQLMQAASVRVPPFGPRSIHHNGRVLNPDVTLAEAGVKALDRLDVRRTDQQGDGR